MALINCSECGSVVSDKAAACPKCGNPASDVSTYAGRSAPQLSEGGVRALKQRRTFYGGVVIFVLVLLGFILYEGNSTRRADEQREAAQATANVDSSASDASAAVLAASQAPLAPPPAMPAPPAAVIEIQASQLYAEYKDNEVRADTKYKGNWLYVSGTVNEVGKDVLDDPYISLVGDNEYDTVQAMFAKSAIRQLAQLHKGERISLMCRGNGKMIINVMLDCTSDDAPPAPRHSQTAAPSAPTEPALGAQAADTSSPPGPMAAALSESTTPSFDCAKAHSTSEMLICGDPELAAADRDLAIVYTRAKAAATDQAAFKERVRQQWNYRERTCRDKDCVVRWYADQKAALTQIAETGKVDGAQ